MAHSSKLMLIWLIVLMFASSLSCLEGRKLAGGGMEKMKKATWSSTSSRRDDGSLYLSSLPKGTVSSSSPSHRGNAVVVDEKLIARHLITVDRILRSVPSPGAGH